MTGRRFPPPWTVIENAESFWVQDAGGRRGVVLFPPQRGNRPPSQRWAILCRAMRRALSLPLALRKTHPQISFTSSTCRSTRRSSIQKIKAPQAQDAAARDRASPNGGQIARAAIGAEDGAADHSATVPGRARQSRHHARHALPRGALAARRCPQVAEVRGRSRAELNQIRALL
jgi:hypothetical protein